MIVIRVFKGDLKIRIISAYYADDPKYNDFIDNYYYNKRVREQFKKQGFLNGNTLSEEELAHLKEVIEYKNRKN
jgi:hypothetical protein